MREYLILNDRLQEIGRMEAASERHAIVAWNKLHDGWGEEAAEAIWDGLPDTADEDEYMVLV